MMKNRGRKRSRKAFELGNEGQVFLGQSTLLQLLVALDYSPDDLSSSTDTNATPSLSLHAHSGSDRMTADPKEKGRMRGQQRDCNPGDQRDGEETRMCNDRFADGMKEEKVCIECERQCVGVTRGLDWGVSKGKKKNRSPTYERKQTLFGMKLWALGMMDKWRDDGMDWAAILNSSRGKDKLEKKKASVVKKVSSAIMWRA